MSDNANERPQIRITEVSGGDTIDVASLMECYFEAPGSPDIYLFFDVRGNRIPTIPEFITLETPAFQFIRLGMLWTMSELKINQSASPMTVDGHWSNPRHPSTGDDDGHFHAQSGPGVEEVASSATA